MSYIDDHPTNFYWRSDIQAIVNKLQAKWPWKTYVNTYWWHPPYSYPLITIHYDNRSFDVWGGGGTGPGNYSGYRGKYLPPELGKQIFNWLFSDKSPGQIHWIIYRGRMWVRGQGWQPAPSGPPDSDPGHWRHIHVTYL